MLCPPITSSSESQQTMEVDEEEGIDISEEDDRFKALSCIDRVRMLHFSWLSALLLLFLISSQNHQNFRFCRQRDHVTMNHSFPILLETVRIRLVTGYSSPVLYKVNKVE